MRVVHMFICLAQSLSPAMIESVTREDPRQAEMNVERLSEAEEKPTLEYIAGDTALVREISVSQESHLLFSS